MKKIQFLLTALGISVVCFGQSVSPKSIEDRVLGWTKIYKYKGAKQPLKVDAKSYSIAQMSICDTFVNWMQASYTPKGGLGDAKRFVSEKLGLYNQNDAALPPSYGAYTNDQEKCGIIAGLY
jgi:hypothetical protein